MRSIGRVDYHPRDAALKRSLPEADLNGMELRQLQHFVAVVEEGSFGEAANRLNLTPSSISGSIRALDRELRAELFVAGTNGATLTDAGWAMLEPARAALTCAQRARSDVAASNGVLRGCIRIATVPAPRDIDVMATVHHFQRDHPDVDVQVVQDGARRVLELVNDGQVDVGITPVTARARSSVRFEPLVSAPLVLICPVGHRLAGARFTDPAELVDETIVDLPRGWWARDAFDRMFAARDLFRRSRLECADPLAVLRTVRDGSALGYGLAAEVDSEAFPAIASTALAGAPSCEIGLVTRRGAGRRQPVAAFLDAYRDQCGPAGLGDEPALAPSAGPVPLLSIA